MLQSLRIQISDGAWRVPQPKANQVLGHTGGAIDAINDKGEAVGASGNCSAASHAVLWQDGVATDLGNLGGTPPGFFEATAINNQSQIVGFSDLPGNTIFHAFFWQNGVIHDLGTLTADAFSFASAINNRGQAVGTSIDLSGAVSRAFLWQNGVMTDLNALVSASSPFLGGAFGINDRGQITGITADFHAFLATPCDEERANNGGCNDGAEGKSTATQQRNVVLPENVRKMLRQRLGRYPKPSLEAPTD